MLYVALKGHDWTYSIEDVTRLFGTPKPIYLNSIENDKLILESSLEAHIGSNTLTTALYNNGEVVASTDTMISEEDERTLLRRTRREVKRQSYICLSKHLKKELPWGTMTGIRPAKLVREMMEEGLSEEEIKHKLLNYYLVSKEKIELVYEVAVNEMPFIKNSDKKDIGLYIGIPFCPSRCLYCSFTSNPIDKYMKKVDPYIEALKVEIEETARLIKDKGFKLRSIYMGGGTPTAINHNQLDRVLSYLEDYLDFSNLREFTVEAGRPDSINVDKLKAIARHPVDRISINPQTMNEDTLKLIGRAHTPKDIEVAFSLAREQGFKNINMDIIMGLPNETLKDFHYTLEKIKNMSPESLTVHSLAVKRASRLKEQEEDYELANSEINEMLDSSYKAAKAMGMHPYYLYRQKNMVGDLENTGYCKKGLESDYNIQIMEETQTILALGAGAVTKAVFHEEDRIERAGNVKNVDEYIERVDEMVRRKEELFK